MDLPGKIRRWHYRDWMGFREIATKTSLSRNTVRKYLRDRDTVPNYPERQTAATKLTLFLGQLNAWLDEDERLPRKHRRNSTKLHAAFK